MTITFLAAKIQNVCPFVFAITSKILELLKKTYAKLKKYFFIYMAPSRNLLFNRFPSTAL